MGFSDPDPKVKAEWTKIPCKDEVPTPDELLAYVVRQAKKKNVDVLRRRYFRW